MSREYLRRVGALPRADLEMFLFMLDVLTPSAEVELICKICKFWVNISGTKVPTPILRYERPLI